MDPTTFLDLSIKEVLKQNPKVEKTLEEFGIGCALCTVGSCMLRDIVEIHDLSTKDEDELMARLARILYPDSEVVVPRIERKATPKGEIRYSPPMKRLVKEHALIKRLLVLIPKVIETLELNFEKGKGMVLDCVDFIRSYADKYHHAKEEDILFSYFDEDLDILKVIHQDHESGRAHVRAIMEGIKNKDTAEVREHLMGYKDLLSEHIRKEDEILYPFLDRNLSMNEIGRMYQQFGEVEERFGDSPKNHDQFIDRLENKLSSKEVIICASKVAAQDQGH